MPATKPLGEPGVRPESNRRASTLGIWMTSRVSVMRFGAGQLLRTTVMLILVSGLPRSLETASFRSRFTVDCSSILVTRSWALMPAL